MVGSRRNGRMETIVTLVSGQPTQFPSAREICISDVAPVRRHLSHGVFNDDAETGLPARDRVIKILCGFLRSAEVPPVEIVAMSPGAAHNYRLSHGAHRFYLSIAA